MAIGLEDILDVVLPIAGGATGYLTTGGNTIATGGGVIIGSTVATLNRTLDLACDWGGNYTSFKNLLGLGAGAITALSGIVNATMY